MVTVLVTDKGVILYTKAQGSGTAGRKRDVIILHLRATSNEFLHKRLHLPCIIYASINFPSWLYLLCKFSCLFTGKAMVPHLWLLCAVEGPYRASGTLNKWLDSVGAGHILPSCQIIPLGQHQAHSLT